MISDSEKDIEVTALTKLLVVLEGKRSRIEDSSVEDVQSLLMESQATMAVPRGNCNEGVSDFEMAMKMDNSLYL